MGGLWAWVASQWRREWRALVGLTLLVAFGGAVTIAAVAGARRADSAFDRLLDESSASIEVAFAGQPGDVDMYDDLGTLADEIAAIPRVDGVLPVSWMGVAAEANGRTLSPFAIALLEAAGERPPVGALSVRGRLPDPTAADEVTINEVASEQLDLDVGDQITLNTYTPDQVDAMVSGRTEPFRGPRLIAEVVGVFRSAEDVSDNSEPMVILTDAFRREYGDRVAKCDCALWVRAATEDVPAVSAALPSTYAGDPLLVEPTGAVLSARVEDAVGLEVGALRIAAVIGGLAAALVVAQAMARHIGAERSGSSALSALGATRGDVVRSWIVILAPVAIAGALGAALGALALSPLFPRGLARRAVIHPGLRFDAIAVVGGALVVVLVTFALALGAAHFTVGRTVRRRESRSGALTQAWVMVTRPTVALGASLATDPGRDRARLAALGAVAGLALAVSGAVAVALIDVSADEVLRTPRAFAADWDLEMSEPPDDEEAVIAATAAEPIDAFAISVRVDGSMFAVAGPEKTSLASPGSLDPIVGSMGPFIDRGRAAQTAEDVVLGESFAQELDVDLGDRIEIDLGDRVRQPFVVSGIGRLSDGDETDRAFFVTPEGLGRLQITDEPAIDGAYVRLGDVDDGVRERLAELGWTPTSPPSRVANLSEIGSVPRLLAIALGALGLGGVVHSLLVASRRRRHDLAVAMSLGFTRTQLASTVRWQGLLTASAAIVVGLPLGVIVGRLIWKQVADGVGALDLVSIPWATFVVVPAAALLMVGALGTVVGQRTARLDPARTLRGE